MPSLFYLLPRYERYVRFFTRIFISNLKKDGGCVPGFSHIHTDIFCVCCIALLCINHRVVVRWNTLNWIYRPRIFLTHKKQPLKQENFSRNKAILALTRKLYSEKSQRLRQSLKPKKIRNNIKILGLAEDTLDPFICTQPFSFEICSTELEMLK